MSALLQTECVAIGLQEIRVWETVIVVSMGDVLNSPAITASETPVIYIFLCRLLAMI